MSGKVWNIKRLNMPGLKPSDYYLFNQEKEYFNFDMRQIVVLGLRCIYAGLHGQITAEQIKDMAYKIINEDLDREEKDTRPTYHNIHEI